MQNRRRLCVCRRARLLHTHTHTQASTRSSLKQRACSKIKWINNAHKKPIDLISIEPSHHFLYLVILSVNFPFGCHPPLFRFCAMQADVVVWVSIVSCCVAFFFSSFYFIAVSWCVCVCVNFVIHIVVCHFIVCSSALFIYKCMCQHTGVRLFAVWFFLSSLCFILF